MTHHYRNGELQQGQIESLWKPFTFLKCIWLYLLFTPTLTPDVLVLCQDIISVLLLMLQTGPKSIRV